MENTYSTLTNLEDFHEIIRVQDAVLIYFSHEACNVCKVLKPKIGELIKNDFPKIKLYDVDTKQVPDISGQLRIFTVPTLIVYFGGQEYIRKSRNIGIKELSDLIERPYNMIFSN